MSDAFDKRSPISLTVPHGDGEPRRPKASVSNYVSLAVHWQMQCVGVRLAIAEGSAFLASRVSSTT